MVNRSATNQMLMGAHPRVSAVRFVRRMAGGTQAHLIECSDGDYYAVKFSNNPQGRRTLVNEWITSSVLTHLGLATPQVAAVDLSIGWIEDTSGIGMQFGRRIVMPKAGRHFGSRYPGVPNYTPVYDFLPDQMLSGVCNGSDFIGALVVDKWLGNCDWRQAIFVRDSEGGSHSARAPFRALLIDHSLVANGANWSFPNVLAHGIYPRHLVYETVVSMAVFEGYLSAVASFPEIALRNAFNALPSEWIEGEEAEAERLLEDLWNRRTKVASLIEDLSESLWSPFQRWSTQGSGDPGTYSVARAGRS